MMPPDYYAVLGVARDADAAAIKAAYRSLAVRYHPDRGGQPGAAGRFKAVVEAYAVLGDAERRERYDQGAVPAERSVEQGGSLAEAVGGVVDRLFGAKDRRASDGRNRLYRLSVSLREAMLGVVKELKLPVEAQCDSCEGLGFPPGGIPVVCARCRGVGEVQQRPFLRAAVVACADCDGRGYRPLDACEACGGAGARAGTQTLQVTIPAGVTSASKLLVRGAGEPGAFGGANGDLQVAVDVAAHPLLRRDGVDVVVSRPLSLLAAMRGGGVRVPTLEGARTIRIPAGTQHGTVLRMVGHGGRRADGTRGDQRVEVSLEVPAAGDAWHEALDRFAEALGPDAFPRSAAFEARMDDDG